MCIDARGCSFACESLGSAYLTSAVIFGEFDESREGRSAHLALVAPAVAPAVFGARSGRTARGLRANDLSRRRRARRGGRAGLRRARIRRRHRARRRLSPRADTVHRRRDPLALRLGREPARRFGAGARARPRAREAARRARRTCSGARRRNRARGSISISGAGISPNRRERSSRRCAAPSGTTGACASATKTAIESPRRAPSIRSGLVSKAGVWYLVARCGDELRSFRVDRIRSAEELTQRFERPASFDLERYWRESSARFNEASRSADCVVTLRARNDALERLSLYWPAEVVSHDDGATRCCA